MNGTGKSTIMKMIMGRVPSDRGVVRLGANVIPAYYDQLHGHISGSETVLDHFTEAYPRLTQTEIRTMLGTFLFSGEEVEKTLDMLSGGEKARLELMKLILQPANLLLLDEPTNHLDLDGTEWLEDTLKKYRGSVMVISHDRYFLNSVCDHMAEIRQTRLTQYTGNYDEFEVKRAEDIERRIKEYTLQQAEIERQGLEKYLAGDYQLGVLNDQGQHISIRVTIIRRDTGNVVSFETGWMARPNGRIQLATPYGGK